MGAKSKDKSQQSSEGKDGEYQKETKTSKDDDKGTFSSDKEKEKDASIVDFKSLQPIEIKGEKCQEETKTSKDDQDKEPSSSDKEKDENADIVDSPASSNDKNLQSSEVKDMFSIMKGIPQAQIKEDIEEYKEEIKILKDDDKDAITQDKEKDKNASIVDLPAKSNDKGLHTSEMKGEKSQEDPNTHKDDQEKEKLSSDKDKNKDADKIDSSVSSHDKDLQSSEVKEMFSLLKEIPQAHLKGDVENDLSKKQEDKIPSGILTVTIHKASQLENLDMVGKSDPYVKVCFDNNEWISKKVKNTLEPEWNFTTDIEIDENQDEELKVAVYDSDLGKDDVQGTLHLPLTEVTQQNDINGSWYDLSGCKSGKVLISFEFKSTQNANNIDDVDGASDPFCDNIKKEKHYLETEVDGEENKQKIAIPSLEKDGEPHQELIVKDEDMDKHDDDISESDYSFVTVVDISKKDDISQSESEHPNRVAKDTELKSDEKDIIPKDESKGFITSIKEAVGGYFYGAEKGSDEPKKRCFKSSRTPSHRQGS